MVTFNFSRGDRVVLARHSKSKGDFGISAYDYGLHGRIEDQIKASSDIYYNILIDGGRRWNVTEDQLDGEEGPW